MVVISGLGTYLTDNRPVEFTEQEHYVVTYVPKKPFTTLDTDNINVNDVAVAVSYVDGLGRPIQSVNVKASASGNDIVQHAEYDSIGRETHKYLPYVKSVNPGMFDREAAKGQKAYYMSDQVQEVTTTPYAVTVFDNTPLNRVDKQGAPGEDWQPVAGNSNDHTVKTVYRTNKMWEVLRFEIDQQTGEISCNSYYATDALTAIEITDENNKSVTIEYTNFKGQIVLKSSKLSDNEYAQTYYVYDNFGLLRAVITPKAVKNMFSSGWINNISYSNDIIKELCYYYNYDERKRMIMKQLPGAEPIYMVYDKRDRLVVTQDGEQRKNHKWLYTKYDHINRPVQTGIYTADSDLNQQQMRELVEANSNMFEVCTNGVYSNNCFPQSNTTLYTETIYDRYYPSLFTDVAFNTNAEVDSYSGTYNTEVKGQITYTKVRVLDASENRVNDTWSYTASYYDDKYRNIQSVSKTVIPGGKTFTEIIGTNYNFTGRVENTIYTHNLKGKDSIAVKQRNEYDHADRLLRTYQELEGDVVKSEIRYASFEYDELGQMIKKELNGSEINTNYNYNIRGWLKQIENTGSNGGNLFSMNLYYNNKKSGVNSDIQHNGNISAISWQNSNKAEQAYGYTYDNLNRLKVSDYAGTKTDGYNTSYGYDINGNITNLNRSMVISDNVVNIDVLGYTYKDNSLSNQLKTVTDAGTTEGFRQGSGDYLYDDNGNMTVDPNKGLSDIKYNNLNLPYSITKGADKVGYIYDVAGRKFANILPANDTIFYSGSFVYRNGDINYMICSDGLLNINATTKESNYEFHLKDHLGNTRVAVNENNIVTQTNNYYPFGLTFAQSGSSTNKYLYNGKEKQEETEWLDYGARMYTPELGRWFNPDPLAEQYLSQSTYHFSGNNPMRFVDLNGMNYDDYGVDSNGNITLLNETDDNYDVLYAVDENKKKKDTTGDGKVTESDGVKVEEGKKREDRSILPKLAKKDSEYNGGRWASSKSLKDIGNVFLYAATHSNVEWAFRAFEKGGSETFVVSTSNKESSVRQITSLSIFDEKDVTIALHSHPGENDTKGASYAGGRGDWKNVIKYYGRWTKSGKDPHKFPTHGVYHRYSRTIFYYTPWNKSIKGHTFKKTKRRPYMGK
jgi:RHS repeat-associated protein